MNWWLRKLLASFRDTGCPPPAEPDWEPPCPTCRATDAVLSEAWRPLEWQTDGALVADLDDGRFATVEADGRAWSWRLEAEDGWKRKIVGEGTEASLADAVYAVERLARESQ